ncbi:MAG: hypothetical protein WBO68_15190, partial [Pyrinomonadaceae bacterium]
EELLKKEITKQMGRMMASGEAVPITALEGVTTTQAETLAEKGIDDVEKLAATSVDDLVEYLDVSLDQAESILSAAALVVEAKNAEAEPKADSAAEVEELAEEDISEELVENATEAEVEAEAVEEPIETETAVEAVEAAASDESHEEAEATTVDEKEAE